jgi:hypothetical protein
MTADINSQGLHKIILKNLVLQKALYSLVEATKLVAALN